jgi:hypothetical protein
MTEEEWLASLEATVREDEPPAEDDQEDSAGEHDGRENETGPRPCSPPGCCST